jgi:hypothetical protein
LFHVKLGSKTNAIVRGVQICPRNVGTYHAGKMIQETRHMKLKKKKTKKVPSHMKPKQRRDKMSVELGREEINPSDLDQQDMAVDKLGEDQTKKHEPYEM